MAIDPYPHQLRVYELLAQGKSVILRAPTGSGKTQASLYPFLASMDPQSTMWGQLPRKCIYSVPMRVLAKQFHMEYTEIVRRYNKMYAVDVSTSIQTGDMPQDPELTNNLIFATIDQTLSSFLMSPYGLSYGKANLNLGAILSSYLVFDEFHLYDPDSTLPTTLQMLRMLQGITPFVLMTATFSDKLVQRLADKLGAEVVGLSDEDRVSYAVLPSQQKMRRYHTRADVLTAQTVLEQHTGRSVVICNTVARARAMARRLREQTSDTEIILLHSQFLREDRDKIEDSIRKHFGEKAPPDGSVIVVSTQAIEVGVDITSTAMHTELAPANAIIQRAGRCARYKDDVGDVYIYRHVQDQHGETIDLYERTNPYSGTLQQPQIPRTFEAFQHISGQPLDFDGEQHIIDTVHAEADMQNLASLDADTAKHRQSMFAAMRGDHDHVGELVRKVIAQPLIIHDAPETVKHPYDLPSFSLHPGSLQGYANDWLKHFHSITDDDLAPSFAVKILHTETDPDNSSNTLYAWQDLGWNAKKERAAHIPYGTLVVVHPALASYTQTDGLIPEVGGGWDCEIDLPERENGKRNYTYKLETYAEHIRLVWKAAFAVDRSIRHDHAYWEELEWAAARLAEQIGVKLADIRQAAELTIALHDVGKLSTGWQGWVRKYQAEIDMVVDPDEAYAHTEQQTDYHREVEKRMPRKPPHAVESAVAALIAINALPEKLWRPVFTAISRHHGAFTANYTPIQLETFALDKVNAELDHPVIQLLDRRHMNKFNDDPFTAPREPQTYGDTPIQQFFVYALLVRLLRRADVKGTMWGSQ